MDDCAQESSCANVIFRNYPILDSHVKTFIASGTFDSGYRTLMLNNSISIKKGTFIGLQFNLGTLAVDMNLDNSLFSDYFITGSSLVRINKNNNFRFYVNALTDTEYFINYVKFNKNFSDLFIEGNTLYIENINVSFLYSNTALSFRTNYFISNGIFTLIFNSLLRFIFSNLFSLICHL